MDGPRKHYTKGRESDTQKTYIMKFYLYEMSQNKEISRDRS